MTSAIARLQSPLRLRVGNQHHPAAYPDADLDNAILRGAKLQQNVRRAVTGAELVRKLEGASEFNLTLYDPDWDLLRSPLFEDWPEKSHIDFGLRHPHGTYWFRLAALDTPDQGLTLNFEDREVAWLRLYDEPLRAYRDEVTRAEFVNRLRLEPKEGHIAFLCPELHKKQPVDSGKAGRTTQSTVSTATDSDRKAGFADTSGLTAKGVPLDAAQVNILERAFQICDQLNAPHQARVALVTAMINETVISDLSGGDRDSVGVLQVRFGRARSVEDQVRMFLTEGATGTGGAIQRARNGESVQQFLGDIWFGAGSTYPGLQYMDEARRIVDAWSGGSFPTGGGTTQTVTTVQRYRFTRGTEKKREDSWECIQRLAKEVRWRAWMSEARLSFIAEEDLFRSRPRWRFSKRTEGILDIQATEFDKGRKVGSITVTAMAKLWQADPGSVVQLFNCGPLNGDWLVFEVRRSIFSQVTEIKLHKPIHSTPEPPNPTTTRTIQSNPTASLSTGGATNSSKYWVLQGTPEDVVNRVVDFARLELGFDVTRTSVRAANAAHGPTITGSTSDHQGPPNVRWAADISNGYSTPEEAHLAAAIAKGFGIPWDGSGLAEKTEDGYRMQLIHNTMIGGNHYDHVHFGVAVA